MWLKENPAEGENVNRHYVCGRPLVIPCPGPRRYVSLRCMTQKCCCYWWRYPAIWFRPGDISPLNTVSLFSTTPLSNHILKKRLWLILFNVTLVVSFSFMKANAKHVFVRFLVFSLSTVVSFLNGTVTLLHSYRELVSILTSVAL